MKLIIAGGRDFTYISTSMIGSFLEAHSIYWRNIEQVVSGGASGVDTAGENFANIVDIEIERFPADWNTHGKAAGPIRNKQMAEYADALLLIWDGESRGSASMKNEMLKLGKPVYEIIIRKTI